MSDDPYVGDDDFMTYQDVMDDLVGDRDDSNDPEYRNPDGYCPHGEYVGGCGVDLMCHWCEDGISVAEARRIVQAERLRGVRERAEQTQDILNKLLKVRHVDDHGVEHVIGGIDAAYFAQESSHIGNPLTRYGRH